MTNKLYTKLLKIIIAPDEYQGNAVDPVLQTMVVYRIWLYSNFWYRTAQAPLN